MQHDYNISNQTFPATRADLNNALQSIKTHNSGNSAPPLPQQGMIWLDTSTSPATYKAYNSLGSWDVLWNENESIAVKLIVGSPKGIINPTKIGLLYFDTNDLILWVSTGTANNKQWMPLNLNNGSSYGLVGDGIADDTIALQNAINYTVS